MGADHIRKLSTSIDGAQVSVVAHPDTGGAAGARFTPDPSELTSSSDVVPSSLPPTMVEQANKKISRANSTD
ncbi:hypothetical protein GU243_24070 (plasmid) [Pseudarthrobacter psychrotolerans]|uniref:Uncharacterized protein n=1 Tax=Pseudarthrobacter psychrotolerans TaxID=2697569 RepID=A0A6P1NV73_9MICC|nr:hypothetical protein [Pseudarthrobacter psychrotolerans]QHK22637.1 hypothetical protein GU243_24070 [Pseudarthrobacter psychrotolerans]